MKIKTRNVADILENAGLLQEHTHELLQACAAYVRGGSALGTKAQCAELARSSYESMVNTAAIIIGHELGEDPAAWRAFCAEFRRACFGPQSAAVAR